MSSLLTDEAKRLLVLERLLRGAGICMGGPAYASPATFKRDLLRLRSEMGAVVVFDRMDNRYRLVNRAWPGVLPHLLEEAANPAA